MDSSMITYVVLLEARLLKSFCRTVDLIQENFSHYCVLFHSGTVSHPVLQIWCHRHHSDASSWIACMKHWHNAQSCRLCDLPHHSFIHSLFTMGKLEFPQLSFFIRAACCVPFRACCVLRACVNGTMGIHSFNFSSVLRGSMNWPYT